MKILNPFALVSYFESTDNTVTFSVLAILLVSAVDCKLRALAISTTCFAHSVAGRECLLPSPSQSSSGTTYSLILDMKRVAPSFLLRMSTIELLIQISLRDKRKEKNKGKEDVGGVGANMHINTWYGGRWGYPCTDSAYCAVPIPLPGQ